MNKTAEVMNRYLLGELSEEDRTALEAEYFTDARVFEELTKFESELVDNYVRGRLSPQLRRQFEQAYLTSPARRERVKFAETLIAKVDQEEISQPVVKPGRATLWSTLFGQNSVSKLTPGLAVAALLLLVCLVWLFTEFRRLRRELAETQAVRATQEERERRLQQQIADEQIRTNRLSAELNEARSSQSNQNGQRADRATPSFVSFVISMTSTRDTNTSAPSVLVIPRATEEVRLQVRMNENSYQSYIVKVQAAGGNEIFSQRNTKPDAGKARLALNLRVPASSFQTGDYVLTVQGTTRQGDIDDLTKSLFHVEVR